MLILMDGDHNKEQLATVVAKIEELGFKSHVLPGANSTAVGITGNSRPLDREFLNRSQA